MTVMLQSYDQHRTGADPELVSRGEPMSSAHPVPSTPTIPPLLPSSVLSRPSPPFPILPSLLPFPFPPSRPSLTLPSPPLKEGPPRKILKF